MSKIDEMNNQKEYKFEKIQEFYNLLKRNVSRDEVQKECIKYLADFRGLDKELLENEGVFYAENKEELSLLVSYDEDALFYLGFKSLDYSNRYLFPILNGKGNLCAWVGYDWEADPSKYLVGLLGIGDKKRLIYGLHDMDEAWNEDTIIVVEGIFDRLRLKSIGLNVGAALLGKKMSDWQKSYINRFRNKILIPDGDSSGQEMIEQWKMGLKGNVAVVKLKEYEKVFHSVEGTYRKMAKDMDDILRDDEEKVNQFINLYNEIKTTFEEGKSFLEVTF